MSEPGSRRVEWPGFRGPNRDAIVHGDRINTNWSTSPPVEIWRRPMGEGWSSFAVAGGLAVTQEQRAGEELVTAYDLESGDPVWTHADAARYETAIAGVGPRATPTIAGGQVFSLGATGRLNALELAIGRRSWNPAGASKGWRCILPRLTQR